MRRIALAAIAASALFATGIMTPQTAAAAPLAGPLSAIGNTGLLQDVAYNCQPIWRCGRYGCGWRRVCYWTPGYYGYRYGHRHWRRHW